MVNNTYESRVTEFIQKNNFVDIITVTAGGAICDHELGGILEPLDFLCLAVFDEVLATLCALALRLWLAVDGLVTMWPHTIFNRLDFESVNNLVVEHHDHPQNFLRCLQTHEKVNSIYMISMHLKNIIFINRYVGIVRKKQLVAVGSEFQLHNMCFKTCLTLSSK